MLERAASVTSSFFSTRGVGAGDGGSFLAQPAAEHRAKANTRSSACRSGKEGGNSLGQQGRAEERCRTIIARRYRKKNKGASVYPCGAKEMCSSIKTDILALPTRTNTIRAGCSECRQSGKSLANVSDSTTDAARILCRIQDLLSLRQPEQTPYRYIRCEVSVKP